MICGIFRSGFIFWDGFERFSQSRICFWNSYFTFSHHKLDYRNHLHQKITNKTDNLFSWICFINSLCRNSANYFDLLFLKTITLTNGATEVFLRLFIWRFSVLWITFYAYHYLLKPFGNASFYAFISIPLSEFSWVGWFWRKISQNLLSPQFHY